MFLRIWKSYFNIFYFCSYVHRNITMTFLTCEPNIFHSSDDDYVDEADQFYSDPVMWLKQQYIIDREANSSLPSSVPLPTHVIFFDELYVRIVPWLREQKFYLCERFFHTHFPEGRIGGYVIVACRSSFSPVKRLSSFESVMQNVSQET